MASSGAGEPSKVSEFRGELELLRALAEPEPTFTDVNHFLSEFRVACQNGIFQSLEKGKCAAAEETEAKLWDMHVRINNRFRKLLSHIRDDHSRGKKRPVERRKLSKHYLNFISASQRFYCGYIQQLLSQYNAIPGLEEVAKRFDIEDYSKGPESEIPEDIREAVVQSCHSTVIYLGDLSRYYAMELTEGKNRKWDRAIGYYRLASLIKPDSGVAHNQLAVIALADGNHLQATYRLYRALSARETHPTAGGNLVIESKKILSAWEKGGLASASGKNSRLISRFVYLHARCYKGLEFPDHDDIENDILQQITVDIEDHSLSANLLQTLCLTNIAADAHAQAKYDNLSAAEQQSFNAPLYFRRLNVKTFFRILELLLSELECSTENVSIVAQRILPSLRHYSSWLITNSELLISETADSGLKLHIDQFWNCYAGALTLMTLTFDLLNLPEIDYLLEEDEDTLGFAPLENDATARRYRSQDGNLKPRRPESRLSANAEMLFRIRDFVVDGFYLVKYKKIPIVDRKAADGSLVFVVMEEGLPEFAEPGHREEVLLPADYDYDEAETPGNDYGILEEEGISCSGPTSSMRQMVDNLVESDPGNGNGPWQQSSLEAHPRCENVIAVQSNIQTSPRPHLPSIIGSPFAPRPGEALSPATRPSTARDVDAGLSLGMEYELTGSLGAGYSNFQYDTPAHQRLSSTPLASTSSASLTQRSPAPYYHHPAGGSFHQPIEQQLGHHLQYPMGSLSSGYPYSPSGNMNPAVNRILQQTPPSGQGG